MGEFLDAELAGKLSADVYIGCTKENYFPVKEMGGLLTASIQQSLGFENPGELKFVETAQLIANRAIAKSEKGLIGVYEAKDFCSPECRMAEIPSANGNCSARGLAKVAAMMANKGTFNGATFLSQVAWESMHADPKDGELSAGWSEKFTQGGVAQYGGNRTGYYGWCGYGGSAFHWHPELKIGFAYTCTLLYSVKYSTVQPVSSQFHYILFSSH